MNQYHFSNAIVLLLSCISFVLAEDDNDDYDESSFVDTTKQSTIKIVQDNAFKKLMLVPMIVVLSSILGSFIGFLLGIRFARRTTQDALHLSQISSSVSSPF
mmetsp:Transcript_3130/g.4353  ORF Transcript_3130/g.4353 Transcript_3130/m.4353 type:complete len:102 (+) Transcript_3130:54-359(+)